MRARCVPYREGENLHPERPVIARRIGLAVQPFILCLLPAGIALAALGSGPAAGRAAPSFHAPAIAQLGTSLPRTLRLQNNTWAQVRVEVRVGPDRTCDALGTLSVQVLQQGQEWAVQFDDPVVCWRRDQTPGDVASSWTAWNRLQLTNAETRAVAL